MTASALKRQAERDVSKALTGIAGFDEITGGGLPRGRASLVCGGTGSGKTLFAMEFLVRGATQCGEPGVFLSFEETKEELAQNVRSLGFDVSGLAAKKKLVIDFVRVERNEIEEAGEYDLDGLFVRLGHAIDSIGAKRVVLDTIEALFSGLSNDVILRAELRRLFRWLKDKGVTAVITAERGRGMLTRKGLEEYVSDAVVLLDHRVIDQISTRRLRVVKYRGTSHGTNEYPFLIDESGFSVLPITSLGLRHDASNQRISSGVPRLDAMLGGEGYYRGSTVLASGTAGSGKSSLAAHFACAAARRGERCLYFAFEESPSQIIRNMRSIGLDLGKWLKKGLLRFHAIRPSTYGLEMHLATFHKLIKEFEPQVTILDPITSLVRAGAIGETRTMLTRLIDFLKMTGTTALLTHLSSAGEILEGTPIEVSSLVDTWLLLRDIELCGERNHALYVLKSRGMAHSNQIREFVLTSRGINLLDVYLGPDGMMTGSARQSEEARVRASDLHREQELESRRRELARKRAVVEARIAALRKQMEIDEAEANLVRGQDRDRERVILADREAMARSRQADAKAVQDRAGKPKAGRE